MISDEWRKLSEEWWVIKKKKKNQTGSYILCNLVEYSIDSIQLINQNTFGDLK